MSSAKWRPLCLGLNVLNHVHISWDILIVLYISVAYHCCNAATMAPLQLSGIWFHVGLLINLTAEWTITDYCFFMGPYFNKDVKILLKFCFSSSQLLSYYHHKMLYISWQLCHRGMCRLVCVNFDDIFNTNGITAKRICCQICIVNGKSLVKWLCVVAFAVTSKWTHHKVVSFSM